MARRRKKKRSKEGDQMQSAGIFCAQRKMRGIMHKVVLRDQYL